MNFRHSTCPALIELRRCALVELLSSFAPPLIRKLLVAGPKRKWRATVESMADQAYPEWRAHFDTTGQRLPTSLRKTLIPRYAWAAEREKFIDSFLSWVGASPDPQSIAETQQRLDAVVEFTAFVAREFLISNYSPENGRKLLIPRRRIFMIRCEPAGSWKTPLKTPQTSMTSSSFSTSRWTDLSLSPPTATCQIGPSTPLNPIESCPSSSSYGRCDFMGAHRSCCAVTSINRPLHSNSRPRQDTTSTT
jgi:hypothetical protein